MSFSPISRDIIKVIENAESGSLNNSTNLLQKSTLGLKQTYFEILANKRFPSTKKSTFPTNELGQLLLGKSSPILAHRYTILECIALGSFSQIFKVVDLYRNVKVAVKVMRVGYTTLGLRESSFLQLMQSKTSIGNQYCKR